MTLEEHKVRLGLMLTDNSIKPHTKKGADVIWAYWCGVVTESGKEWTYVSMMLSCGRADELQTPPEVV